MAVWRANPFTVSVSVWFFRLDLHCPVLAGPGVRPSFRRGGLLLSLSPLHATAAFDRTGCAPCPCRGLRPSVLQAEARLTTFRPWYPLVRLGVGLPTPEPG